MGSLQKQLHFALRNQQLPARPLFGLHEVQLSANLGEEAKESLVFERVVGRIHLRNGFKEI
jgi:hypothetical protein